MGPAGAPTWHAILDGAELIMREEGYAALNAKRIAERTGIKRQLVYYYFNDIEDLHVQLFHRIADRALDHLRAALETSHPLRETWHMGIDSFDQTLVVESMALANRNAKLRDAMNEYTRISGELQIAALRKELGGRPLPALEISLPALAAIAKWVALGIQHEIAHGIDSGHEEVLALVRDFLAACEQPSNGAA
jgi:AcrR family transcriptional regulator